MTNPSGGGNRNIQIIRDGDKPPVGNTDSNRQYDTYDGSNPASLTEDWIGYTYAIPQVFTRVVFQEGKHFVDGGWFSTLTAQVRRNGAWGAVTNLVVTPAYPGANNNVNFETYTLDFSAISGDGIRIYGAPGGSAHFISVGELTVFGGVVTNAPAPATATPTITPIPAATQTSTRTATASITATASLTRTATPPSTATVTASTTQTPTPVASATSTSTTTAPRRLRAHTPRSRPHVDRHAHQQSHRNGDRDVLPAGHGDRECYRDRAARRQRRRRPAANGDRDAHCDGTATSAAANTATATRTGTATATATAVAGTCGDGRLDAGETCDDANGVSGDCCANCQIEATPCNLTQAGTIVALVTSPTGGGSRNIQIIRDGDMPPVGNTDSNREYDTYDGSNPASVTEDWIGYTYAIPQVFTRVVFQEGKNFVDGGWFSTLTVQVRRNGTWGPVSNLTITPAYPITNNNVNFETYTLNFSPISGDGIRIYGDPAGSANFISIGELRVFGGVVTQAPNP